MKGVITHIVPKDWTAKDGAKKTLYEFSVAGDERKFSCFQDMSGKKQGDEIEFEPEGGANSYGFVKARLSGSVAKGGFQRSGKSPEEIKLQSRSFAASYSKDIVCACIEKGIVTDSKTIDAALIHYDNFFKGILEG